jgi:hypothetical protein
MAVGGVNPWISHPHCMKATLTEFAENSFRDASLIRILKRGDEQRQFYYRFEDKMELTPLLYRVQHGETQTL